MANTYQIKPGDTLGRIAAAQHISMADLLAANRQITNPDRVQVGQIINLPAPAASPAAPGGNSRTPATPGTASNGAGAVNLAALKGHIKPEVLAQIPAIIDRFRINSPLVMAHFLAQCAHESCDFSTVTENLNYSITALKGTFGKYFATEALLNSYARKPEAIGSRVYALRNGNGNEASKDGWNFRGRGFLQLTGRSNYAAFAKMVSDDIMSMPDLVAQKHPMLSAAWFFHDRKLVDLAALGATDDVVTRVTKVVNGGTNGLAQRIKYFKTYYDLLRH